MCDFEKILPAHHNVTVPREKVSRDRVWRRRNTGSKKVKEETVTDGNKI